MGEWLNGIKQVGTELVESFKEKVGQFEEKYEDAISFDVDGNSNSNSRKLEDILAEYAQTENSLGGTNAKKQTLKENESKTLLDLYEKLSECDDNEIRKCIQNEITSVEYATKSENIMLEIEDAINNSNLPEEQKEKLTQLYNKAVDNRKEEEKEQIQDEINSYLNKIGIDENSHFAYNLTRNLLIAQGAAETSDIYKQLSNTRDSKQREDIQNKLHYDSEKYTTKVAKFELEHTIASLNLIEDVKKELTSLYENKSKTIDENEQAILDARIEAFANKHDIPKEMLIELDLNANEIAYATELATQYEKLIEADSNGQIEKIKAKIETLSKEKTQNIHAINIQKGIYLTDLPTEQKETLSNLYSLFDKATSLADMSDIKKEIENYMKEKGIDANSSEMLRIQNRAILIEKNKVIANMYEKLAGANNNDQRDKLNAKISEVLEEYSIISNNLHSKANIQESNIPTKTKEQLMNLYDEITNATNKESVQKLANQINEILDKTEFDENTNNKHWLSSNLLQIVHSKELKDEYEKLAEVDDNTQRDKINAKIESIYQDYQAKFNELEQKEAQEKYALEDNTKIDKAKNNQEFEKISKIIHQMGFSIPKDITTVEELQNYLDEIQQVIEDNIEDTYYTFG